MQQTLENLVAAFRGQLLQSGYVLVLLDDAKKFNTESYAASLIKHMAEIRTQLDTLQQSRAQADQLLAALAREMNVPDETEPRAVLGAAPAPYPPLLQALHRENEKLLLQLKQKMSLLKVPLSPEQFSPGRE
jgi:hypothetical protein